MKNFLKNFSFMGMVMLVLCVVLGVGDMSGAIAANGVAAGISTGADGAGAAADAEGISVQHGRHDMLETMDLRSMRPEMIDDPVDQSLVKIRPSVSPLDTILRYAGTNKTNNFEFEWYSLGTRDLADTVKSVTTEAASIEEVEAVVGINGSIARFDVTDTVLFPDVLGADGTPFVGYVIAKDNKGKTITISATEDQLTKGGDGIYSFPAELKSGVAVYSLSRAAGETDVKTPAISYIPKPSRGYCQIFMAQIAQSTYEEIMDKKFKFGANEIEEQALYEYRVRMEGSFLFGKQGKVYDKIKNRYVYMTGGITNQITKEHTVTVANGNEGLTEMMKYVFTGNSGAKERVLLAGSGFVEKMSNIPTVQKQLEAGNTEVVWGIKWNKIESNFGTLMLAHHELLDQYGWSDKAIVLDPQYLKKWQISNFERTQYDGKELAIMNGKFTVFSEVCGVAVYNPDAHCILNIA